MGWETPPAQVASNPVGQLYPAHTRRNKDPHSAHRPERTRVAWDRNRHGCSVFGCQRARHAVLGHGSDGEDAIKNDCPPKSPDDRHSSNLQTRWCWRMSSSRGQSTTFQPETLRPCSHSRRRRRRRSDTERSTQTQSGIQKSPRCCQMDTSK